MTKFKEERGVAMITALLVTMVVLSLSVAIVGLSLHNTDSSAADRKRVQAIAASEAGIDAYFSSLQTSVGAATCSPIDADIPTSPLAHYHVDITLYSTWPPSDTSVLPCPPAVDPLGAVVVSKGTAVTTSNARSVSRTMQSAVRFSPIFGGFGNAIFSDTVLNFQNQLTLNPNASNDADVYTNGNFTLGNNTLISGSVFAQGSASIAQGVVNANVWANGSVTLTSGIQVFGDVTSSTAGIALSNNAHVHGDAKAGTTISGGTIDGTQTVNSPSGPPPQQALPQIPFDQQAWIDDGYVINTYSTCAAAKVAITNGLTGKNVVRVTPGCALSWGNNSTINVLGDLAIITDGSFTTQNQTSWNGVGGTYTLHVIRPYQTGLNCTKPSPYDISVSNNTNFNSLQTFFYSQCNIDFGNNNAGGVPAQIIGGTVNITNQMTMKYSPIIVPGYNLVGYDVEVSYLREIRNA